MPSSPTQPASQPSSRPPEFSSRLLACRLTCAFVPGLERGFPCGGFSHVVAGCRAAVLRSWRAAGAGFAGFRRTGRRGRVAWMFRNPRRTRAGVSRPGGAGRSQGRRRSAASGRASRSWAWQAMISQVHRSAAAGSRIFGVVQPRTCLNRRKVCSRSNRRKNACQQPVHFSWRGAGARAPQPDGLGVAVAGQMIHLQPDQGAFDHRQRAVVVQPGGAVGQPGMQPVPGLRGRGAVAGGFRGGGHGGAGQVAGSARANSRPCRRGRPLVPGWRGGTGSAAPGRCAAGPGPPPAGQRAGKPAAWGHTRHRRSPGQAGHPHASARPRSGG